jgi:hypothetical protein
MSLNIFFQSGSSIEIGSEHRWTINKSYFGLVFGLSIDKYLSKNRIQDKNAKMPIN